MDTKDEIRTEAFLLKASPETVYEWLKNWPQRTSESPHFWGNNIPKEIELQLLVRKNEIVDLGLAAWGTRSETHEILYQRWCAKSVVAEWPPKRSTYPYAVLASILANVNATLIFKSQSLGSVGVTTEDFDWLIEHCDDDLLRLMHDNIGLGLGLLLRCAQKKDAYGRMDDNRWLTCLGLLGNNKSLHRADTTNRDGPDLLHWDIHKSFVKAAGISPKTSVAASVLGGLFLNLPTSATNGSYVSENELAAAVSSWNVELQDDDESGFSFLKIYRESDALTPSERVQFHLLRHYCTNLDLDPDSPVRVRRLAAYSKNPLNGGKAWNLSAEKEVQKHLGKGLDIDRFERYVERDGPAFMYANSFNENIWCDKIASEKLKNSSMKSNSGELFYPKDRRELLDNREKCVSGAAAKASIESEEFIDELKLSESGEVSAIREMRTELGQSLALLEAQVRNLKRWLVWGGIIVIVLVLLKH